MSAVWVLYTTTDPSHRNIYDAFRTVGRQRPSRCCEFVRPMRGCETRDQFHCSMMVHAEKLVPLKLSLAGRLIDPNIGQMKECRA